MGPWSNLPADLLYVIEDHLSLYIDKVRIRSVSVAWNSYLPKLPNNRIIPWLLHPLKHDNPEGATHGLLNPIDDKVYEIYLPEARGKVFKGSTDGWLVTVEDRDSPSPTDICLINPFTRARISLPPRTEFADVVQYRPEEEIIVLRSNFDVPSNFDSRSVYAGGIFETEMSLYHACIGFTLKFVLSSDPSDDDDCLVVAIYGQADHLAWCRCNDKKWTHIYAGITAIIDITFHEGKLYVITYTRNMYVLENIGKNNLDIKVTQLSSRVPVPRGMNSYLAVSSDDNDGVMFIGRYFDFDIKPDMPTKGFKVYTFDSSNSSWIELENINGQILFLGVNSAKLIASSSHEDLPGGYKGNHIYFTDHNGIAADPHSNENTDADIGVFSLENGTLESFPGLRQPIWPRPIWLNVS